MIEMDESIELKLLRLKKMRQMLSPKPAEDTKSSSEKEDFDKYLKVLKENLTDRGEEVLEAAMKQYPEVTRKIITILAKKIMEGKLVEKISGGELLKLFENLGLHIYIETSIRYYKHGEYKSLLDLLKE